MSEKLSTTLILVSSCGSCCMEVEVSLDGLIAVDADGERYTRRDPENRPNAWGTGTETWLAASVAVDPPWCSKCGAQYKILIHDEFWPGCTCGAATTFERVQVEVFQLEDVEYEDQYGVERKEQRKREVRTLTLTGIEDHRGELGAMSRVFVAVDDQDNVYTKGVCAGTGWMCGTEFWMTRYHKKLVEPTFISLVTDMMILGMKQPATGGVVSGNFAHQAEAAHSMHGKQPIVDLPELLSRFDKGDDPR